MFTSFILAEPVTLRKTIKETIERRKLIFKLVNNSEKTRDVTGVDLIAAFIMFFMLSALAVSAFGFEGALPGWQVIFIMGFNYVPLLLIPFKIVRGNFSVTQILGLSRRDFISTLPYGIPAFLIAGIWQTGLLGFTDITMHPDWYAWINPAAIMIIVLLPLFEMKYLNKGKIIPGFLTLIAWAVYAYFFPMGDEEMSQAVVNACANPVVFWVISFLLGIFVPFAEEYFFRGFVLRFFLTKYRTPYIAILITSTFFGLAHMGVNGMASLALFSLSIGMFTYRTKSIYPAVWAHAGLNLSGMVVVWLHLQIS